MSSQFPLYCKLDKKNFIKIWKKHTYLQSNKINYVILNLSMYYRFYVTIVSFL